MKIKFTFLISVFVYINIFSQSDFYFNKVAEIRWNSDYELFMKMLNDSNYVYDIRNLFHIPKSEICIEDDYIYYPVNLSNEYVSQVNTQNDSVKTDYKTLFSALNHALGGGWLHFINCTLYSIETGQLSLTAPLMKRPESNWKPKPVTETYKRTKNWKFFIPTTQKESVKEFEYRVKHNDLAALNGIPEDFIKLCIKTSDKEYENLRKAGDKKKLAKIDLVKLMLGSNFLGPAQIIYIQSAVLNSVKNYSVNTLPTVLVFDEFEAAAVMSLNLDGYLLEAIVFKKAAEMTETDIEKKQSQIIAIIDNINKCNQNTFIKNLGNYYKN